ncbi:glycoside hydrolase [Arsenicibacter rosenii]|uniref:Glycoside hydrolase n=2 Tax=Arsenicibacter rosenii TaxID=1750698 RepID=A0A1S2VB30_9BACT|nr:glycoside hydrolase [Arsenicibacter rosenii]
MSQLARSGHLHRLSDLDAFAGLDIKTIRYPILWEALAPAQQDTTDWQWADQRLRHLAKAGIQPVVGLVHHGCGPRYATFDQPERFEQGLVHFAAGLARRHPGIQAYTPINEPMTTARFSGLYGHWYPHQRDPYSFFKLLFCQCRATINAMKAIREVNSDAQLIQTEDLGKTHATDALQYQADWENDRRWLTWDLLTGSFTPAHPLWQYCRWLGFTDHELWYFADNPCPPDIIGINHYITSERYLDDNLSGYPEAMWGGNGQHRYVDTEVVRAAPARRAGLGALIEETWARYKRPLALTEVHIGASAEEQLLWLHEAWVIARAAKTAGIDVKAVTSWALLGSFDWHCLVTRQDNHYEPGVYDCRGKALVAMPLEALVRRLAAGRSARDLLPQGKGWWHQRLSEPPTKTPHSLMKHSPVEALQ